MDFKRRRNELGYTIDEIAEYVGVTKRTVINWEKGETLPSEREYRKLNSILALEKDDKLMLTDDIEIKTKNMFFSPSRGTGSGYMLRDMLVNYACKDNYIIHVGIRFGSTNIRILQAAYNVLNLPYKIFDFTPYSNSKFNPIQRGDFVDIMKESSSELDDEKIKECYNNRANELETYCLLPEKERNVHYDMLKGNMDFISELKENKTLFIDLFNDENQNDGWTKTPVYTSMILNTLYRDIKKLSTEMKNLLVCVWDYRLLAKYSNLSKINELPNVRCAFIQWEMEKDYIPKFEDMTTVRALTVCKENLKDADVYYIERPDGTVEKIKFYFGSRFPGLSERRCREQVFLAQDLKFVTPQDKSRYYVSSALKILAKFDLSEKEKTILAHIISLKPKNVKDGVLYINEFLDRLMSKERFESKEEIEIARKFSYTSCKKLITIFNSMGFSLRSFAAEKLQLELLFNDEPENEVFPEDRYEWELKYKLID